MYKIAAIACTVALCAFTISSTLAQDKPASAPPAAADKPPATTDKPPVRVGPPTIEEGQALIQAEEFEQAAEVFHKIVKADPDNSRGWHFLGYSLHAAGNLTDALPCHLMAAEFEQSLTLPTALATSIARVTSSGSARDRSPTAPASSPLRRSRHSARSWVSSAV